MDDVLIPFTMQATVTYGEPPPPLDPLDDGPLPLGWVRIPVSFQITLPPELLEGASRGGAAHADLDAPIPIVPHSLRLGTDLHAEGGRTWTDFGTLLAALGDDPSSPDAAPVARDEPAAAAPQAPTPVAPLPPWRTAGKPPNFESHDAFLDFMDDPGRPPPAAATTSRTPGSVRSGRTWPPPTTPPIAKVPPVEANLLKKQILKAPP